jgi:SnoaL-like domain
MSAAAGTNGSDASTQRALIENLLAQYAFDLDSGRFKDLGELFAHASVTIVGGPVDGRKATGAAEVSSMFRRSILRDPDTGQVSLIRHQTSNVQIILTSESTANAKSYYIAFQQTRTSPLQAVASGMYVDMLELVDGEWRFRDRQIVVDQTGDLASGVQARMGTK